MDEYISREAVNDLIEDIRNNHFILMSDRVTLVLLKSKVAEIPTAAVQPVVRCKDCKYAQNPNDTMVYCTYFECGTMSQDDFCSQGDRRTENENN